MTDDFLFSLLVGLAVGGIGAMVYVQAFIGGFLYSYVTLTRTEEDES